MQGRLTLCPGTVALGEDQTPRECTQYSVQSVPMGGGCFKGDRDRGGSQQSSNPQAYSSKGLGSDVLCGPRKILRNSEAK
jgi:hypothetical protein